MTNYRPPLKKLLFVMTWDRQKTLYFFFFYANKGKLNT